MVAARRPGGEVVLTPFQVEHDAAGLSRLVKTLRVMDIEELKAMIPSETVRQAV